MFSSYFEIILIKFKIAIENIWKICLGLFYFGLLTQLCINVVLVRLYSCLYRGAQPKNLWSTDIAELLFVQPSHMLTKTGFPSESFVTELAFKGKPFYMLFSMIQCMSFFWWLIRALFTHPSSFSSWIKDQIIFSHTRILSLLFFQIFHPINHLWSG